jgi:hypothetical protein
MLNMVKQQKEKNKLSFLITAIMLKNKMKTA